MNKFTYKTKKQVIDEEVNACIMDLKIFFGSEEEEFAKQVQNGIPEALKKLDALEGTFKIKLGTFVAGYELGLKRNIFTNGELGNADKTGEFLMLVVKKLNLITKEI